MEEARTADHGTVTSWAAARRVAGFSAPFHPIVVHFTIGLAIGSLAADAAGYWFDVPSLSAAGFWTMVGACLSTPAALVTGVLSRRRLPMQEGEARSFLRTHMALGPIVTGVMLILVLWRAALWEQNSPISIWYLAAFVGLAALLTVQGYLGGELVYRYGTEVDRAYRELSGHRPSSAPPPVQAGLGLRVEAAAERADRAAEGPASPAVATAGRDRLG